MTVEAYFWPPDLSGRVGHAALWVSGGSPAGDVYLSAWPASVLGVVFGDASYHTYEQDCGDEDGAPYYVALNKLDETAIKTAVARTQQAKNYSFLGFNCAVQASACLNAGVPGNTLPSILELAAMLAGPGNWAWTSTVAYSPWGFWCRAKTLQLQYG